MVRAPARTLPFRVKTDAEERWAMCASPVTALGRSPFGYQAGQAAVTFPPAHRPPPTAGAQRSRSGLPGGL